MILLVSYESEQICEENGVVFAVAFELRDEAGVELARPTRELINDLVFLTNFVELGHKLVLQGNILAGVAAASFFAGLSKLCFSRNVFKFIRYFLNDL